MIFSMSNFPQVSGSYGVLLQLVKPQILSIGRLGEGSFPAGSYAYFGSARGPGGLRARLGRHLWNRGSSHWHIDALSRVAEAKGYCYVVHSAELSLDIPIECFWSQAVTALSEVSIPLKGFGSSDCRSGCQAHLVYCGVSRQNCLDRYRPILAKAIQIQPEEIVIGTI